MRKVVVVGDARFLAYLSDRLQGDVRIVSDRDGHALVSAAIEAAADADAARSIAERLIDELRGAAALERNPGDLAVGHVVDEREDGSRLVSVRMTASVTMDAEIAASGSTAPVDPTSGPTKMALAHLSDPAVSLVLRLLAQLITFGSMYKVLDVIEEDVGGERALAALDWVQKDELRRFTQSANAIENAGGSGRHARSDYRLGKLPAMTEAEALALTRSLVSAWLANRNPGT